MLDGRRARWLLSLCAAAAIPAASLHAQSAGGPQSSTPADTASAPARTAQGGGEEIIFDEELTSAAGGEEIIEDPELASTPSALPAPPVQEANIRVVLHSRAGIDVAWQDPREDVFDWTQLALFEATVRRSQDLRFVVGLRARHLFATREQDTPDSQADRYEFDVTPTAAFADVRLADGLNLRLGYQTVHLGRFDVFGASDILSARDLRSGPATLPEASEIAQPALRLDWDAESWLSLRAIYLPFFQPHLVRPFEGDYALAPSRQDAVDAAINGLNTPEFPVAAAYYRSVLRGSLSRSGQATLAESGFSAFAPEPSLTQPQAALRVDARDTAGELGLTVGITRERTPALVFSDSYLALAEDDSVANLDAFLSDPRPVSVRYDAFGLIALDGAAPVGPFQLGAELAYQAGRTLLTQTYSPQESDLAQLSVRGEWLANRWVVVLEGFVNYALSAPDAPDSRWLFMAEGRALLGIATFVAYTLGERSLTVELGSALLNGPSLVLAPRAELRIMDGLFAELGALVVEGDRPTDPTQPAALTGPYNETDQVFVGLRWLP